MIQNWTSQTKLGRCTCTQDFNVRLYLACVYSPLFQREDGNDYDCLLVIQCDSGHLNGDLIACARYRIYDERVKALGRKEIQKRKGVTHVLFIINLPHHVSSSTFVGFQGDPWISIHIDDLRPSVGDTIEPSRAITATISELFIGEYINDIAPLMDTALVDRRATESESEDSMAEDDNVDRLFTPSTYSLKDNEHYEEGSEFEESLTQDNNVEPTVVSGPPKFFPMSQEPSHPESAVLTEILQEFPHQSITIEPFSGTLQERRSHEEGSEKSQTSTGLVNDIAVVDIEGDDFELEMSAEPCSAAEQNQPGLVVDLLPEHLQESGTQIEPSEDMPMLVCVDDSEPAGLHRQGVAEENVSTGSSARNRHPQGLNSSTAQCSRLYSCIQAAASRIEDLTKERSTQRVTRLMKLIKKHPDHLGGFLMHTILSF